jgi:hypothetical protein
MSINARLVDLDGTGHGTLTVSPTFYCGAKGGGVSSVSAEDGTNLGTAFLTRGTSIACEGVIDVSGNPSGQVTLYFDFD